MQIQLLSNDRVPPLTHCVSSAEPRSWASVADAAPKCHAIRITLGRSAIVILVTSHPNSASPSDPPGYCQGGRSDARPESDADCTIHVRITSADLFAHLKIAHAREALRVRRLGPDPSIERLAQALVAAENMQAEFVALYMNAISVAIVTRLITLLTATRKVTGTGPAKAVLPRWRLQRVIEYVHSHLAQPISLSDMANAAGLTPMHFARQFRAATGIRPHEYLLRRRVEKAQELLRQSANTLVEVALSVGFQTQAHFTTVFKRFAGETPHRWRAKVGKPRALLFEAAGIAPNAVGDGVSVVQRTPATCY
jgi:AraC-like DNA-binding protein